MAVTIGTNYTSSSTKIVLLGSGELGREIAIESIRLGLEVFAVDQYSHAPAMQVAQHSHVIDMTDSHELFKLIRKIKPDFIVPEIEAIATDVLLTLEGEGYQIIPTAKATQFTMNREKIRNLAHELGLPVSKFGFAKSLDELHRVVAKIGFPCVIKPIMSSSGKGQSIIKNPEEIESSWKIALKGGRTKNHQVIVEEWIDFDYEVTLLTIKHRDGTSFCEPIGHIQKNGDYQISWQPQKMSEIAQKQALNIAKTITDVLGGRGIFGVELFVKDHQVWFNEVSPRPHDTGLVTLISQNISEFALHIRAILGLPIPNIEQLGPSASHTILVTGKSKNIIYKNIDNVLINPNTNICLFGKPEVDGKRRMGVLLAKGHSIQEAKAKVSEMMNSLEIELH